MGKKTTVKPSSIAFLVVVAIALFLAYAINQLPKIEPNNSNVAESTQTPTLQVNVTETIHVEDPATEIILTQEPTPVDLVPTYTQVVPTSTQVVPTSTSNIFGTTEIVVGDWHVNRAKCVNITRDWVEVLGVEISGGTPPYNFLFQQKEQVLHNEIVTVVDNITPIEVFFSAPIVINTGSSVNVTINSNTFNGKPSWEGKLFFPYFDPSCINE